MFTTQKQKESPSRSTKKKKKWSLLPLSGLPQREVGDGHFGRFPTIKKIKVHAT